MSDISIPGISSKYNTTKLIDDLVAAERIRITKMEENISSLETTRSIWEQINRDFGSLQRSAKSLYGFENPFSEKTATSSHEGVLTATAARNAPFDSYSISVKQIATSDKFMSTPLKRSYRIQPGTYTFAVAEDNLTFRYRGGTVEDFARRLSERGEGLVRASSIRDTSETQVLMIEAVPTGAKNRLIFEDDAKSLGLQTGMLRVARNTGGTVSLESAIATPLNNQGSPIARDSIRLSEEGLFVQPETSVRLPFENPVKLEDGMVLEYRYRTVEFDADELESLGPSGPKWPHPPEGRFGGLVIKGASNAFPIPSEEPEEAARRIDNYDVLRAESTLGPLFLPPIEKTEAFKVVRVDARDLPNQFSALTLNNNNTHRAIEIADIGVFNPANRGNLEPNNPVGIAGDAIIEFRGIEARRSTNTIDDLVDGLTINLKRVSQDPVDIDINPDTEMAKEGIIRFVFSYNQLITRILVLTSDNPAIIDELEYLSDDERDELKEQQGTFRGEPTLNQAKNRLQGIVSSPYTTRAGRDLALLAQIGISTNASSGRSSAAVNFSKLRGYLEIDEDQLNQGLQSSIDAVKDLFGMDTNGDLIINSGVAQAIDEFLNPYTRTGGLVSTRLTRIDNQIEGTQEDIFDYEDYLEDYEAKLRRQYGIMEATLNQLERSSQDLENFSKQQNNNRQ